MFFVRSITTDIISTSFIFCDTKLIAKLSLYYRNNEIVINEYIWYLTPNIRTIMFKHKFQGDLIVILIDKVSLLS